jgi:hypothetical protein
MGYMQEKKTSRKREGWRMKTKEMRKKAQKPDVCGKMFEGLSALYPGTTLCRSQNF